MADPEDLEALMAGDNDMAERDLRGADLAKMNLRDRDFRRSHLGKANLTGSDLSRAQFGNARVAQANFSHAILRELDFQSSAIVGVDFSYFDATKSRFNKSMFNSVNFNNSVLVGADFSDCHFQEGTTFDNALSDETTKFDGVTIFRPLARQPAFRFYKAERGKLVRLPTGQQPTDSDTKEVVRVITAVRAVQAALTSARSMQAIVEPTIGIGHNGPPLNAALSDEEITEVETSLSALESEFGSAQPSGKIIAEIHNQLEGSANKIGAWAVDKADLFADEFMKSLGKGAGDIRLWVGLWLVVSGQLAALMQTISRWTL